MNKVVMRLAHLMAYLGGLVLLALILLTSLSIIGRSLNGIMHSEFAQSLFPAFAEWALATGIGPINGDYELVEAGMAFAIFAFMPLCQLSVAHASVDIFVNLMPQKVNRFLVWLSEVVFALILTLIAWQLFNGTGDKFRSGETTFLLEFPIWWAYALALVGAVAAALAAIYMAFIRTRELVSGEQLVSDGGGAEH